MSYYNNIIKIILTKASTDDPRLIELFGVHNKSEKLDGPIERSVAGLIKEDRGPQFKLEP